MKLTTTTTHNIKFFVVYFEPTEGGMDTDVFGGKYETLQEAVSYLLMAQMARPEHDWVITADVETVTK